MLLEKRVRHYTGELKDVSDAVTSGLERRPDSGNALRERVGSAADRAHANGLSPIRRRSEPTSSYPFTLFEIAYPVIFNASRARL